MAKNLKLSKVEIQVNNVEVVKDIANCKTIHKAGLNLVHKIQDDLNCLDYYHFKLILREANKYVDQLAKASPSSNFYDSVFGYCPSLLLGYVLQNIEEIG